MLSPDRTTASELDLLARDLEERAGITPAATLRRDSGTPALVRRIRDAAAAVLGGSGSVGDARTITFSVQDPENVRTFAGRGTKAFGAWLNTTGLVLRLARVSAVADEDDYSFTLFKSASKTDFSLAGDTPLVAVTCADNGTDVFTAEVGSFTNDTVEADKWIIWEHSSGTAENVTVVIEGTLE